MQNKELYFLFFIIFSTLSVNVNASPTANVTLKILDQQGNPIENAKANVVFSKVLGSGQGWGESSKSIDVKTDANGLAEFSGETTPHIYYGASKEGYYSSSHHLEFRDVKGILGFRTYIPDNPVLTVILKKKINPIGLYARAYKQGIEALSLPKRATKVGFDLVAGDWVVPYGKGSYKDFVFDLKGEIKGRREFDVELKLSFSNEGDGIQVIEADSIYGSELSLPHNAPEEGYLPVLIQRYATLPDRLIAKDFPENRNYFFRVRSITNEKGEIESALYGKIHGNIKFTPSGMILMQYYVNPNQNDPNVEFDMGNNLFKNLNRRLSVDKP